MLARSRDFTYYRSHVHLTNRSSYMHCTHFTHHTFTSTKVPTTPPHYTSLEYMIEPWRQFVDQWMCGMVAAAALTYCSPSGVAAIMEAAGLQSARIGEALKQKMIEDKLEAIQKILQKRRERVLIQKYHVVACCVSIVMVYGFLVSTNCQEHFIHDFTLFCDNQPVVNFITVALLLVTGISCYFCCCVIISRPASVSRPASISMPSVVGASDLITVHYIMMNFSYVWSYSYYCNFK